MKTNIHGMQLRPYQRQAVQAIEKKWNRKHENNAALLVQATGTGKTIIMADVAERAVNAGGRVLIIAHRKELIKQARDKIKAYCGLDCAIEKAEEHAATSHSRIIIASVQTLYREARLKEYPKNHFTHILIDEAHHTPASSYQKILNYFEDYKLLGVTATPERADKLSLQNIFGSITYEYGLRPAIEDGYLVPIKAKLIPLHIDITNVKITAGDFQAKSLGQSIDPYINRIAHEMKKAGCNNKKTVVFLPLIDTAHKMCDALNSIGIPTEEIDGKSPDRDEILARFEAGTTKCLCCAMLLTEGWDSPSCNCIVVLRPTKSRSFLIQMLGRGCRLHPGKDHLLVLDFLWHTVNHDLCRPATIAQTAKAHPKVTKRNNNNDDQHRKDAEASLAKQLKANSNKKARTIDPLLLTMDYRHKLTYSLTMPIDKKKATPRQLAALTRYGIDTKGITTFNQAHAALDLIEYRETKGLATPRQLRILKKHGFKTPEKWTKTQASKVMTILQNNHWYLPAWLTPATYDRRQA